MRTPWRSQTPHWAGESPSRRSTTDGCIMRGVHCVKTWCKSQLVVALSSGEAELIAATKAATEVAGYRSAMQDFGSEVASKLVVDASAAIGMMSQSGLGTAKHINTRWMWLQGALKRKELTVHKVHTNDNPADLMTKSLGRDAMERHMQYMGFHFV